MTATSLGIWGRDFDPLGDPALRALASATTPDELINLVNQAPTYSIRTDVSADRPGSRYEFALNLAVAQQKA